MHYLLPLYKKQVRSLVATKFDFEACMVGYIFSCDDIYLHYEHMFHMFHHPYVYAVGFGK